MTNNPKLSNTKYKILCPGAWAIPPSPPMIKQGNKYFVCSLCGEPCETVEFKQPSQRSGSMTTSRNKLAIIVKEYTGHTRQDFISAVMAWHEQASELKVLDGQIAELESLNTGLHYGKDYQDSLDELDEEIDLQAEVDVEIKISNGWWSIGCMTAENADRVIQYAGSLIGEL